MKMNNYKIVLVALINLIFLTSAISLVLQYGFLFAISQTDQLKKGISLSIKEQFPTYFKTTEGLFACDVAMMVLMITFLMVLIKPYKLSLELIIIFLIPLLCIRFILAILFLDNPGDQFLELIQKMYQIKVPIFMKDDIELFLKIQNAAYINEIATVIIQSLSAIPVVLLTQKIK